MIRKFEIQVETQLNLRRQLESKSKQSWTKLEILDKGNIENSQKITHKISHSCKRGKIDYHLEIALLLTAK